MDYGDRGSVYSVADVAPTKSRSWLIYGIAGIAVLFIGYLIYAWIRSSTGKPLPSLFGASVPASEDQMPAAVDGKERTVIPATTAPIGQGSDYGLQFWMYIKDWDYKFGQEKDVVKRIAGTNNSIYNPRITLHPTDNSLQVAVKYYSQESSSTATGSTNASGDVFTCTVENVPLQAWFSVSVTVFDRNMDVYINGRLVKSCVIPGVPRPATGDIIVNDSGGFSGSICNLRSYGGMLSPSDAQTFFGAGTTCGVAGMKQSDDSTFSKIFGYTFRFSVLDYKGSELNNYTF
jgi:hypothetical protein